MFLVSRSETVSTRYWGGIPLGHQGRPAKNERYAEATDDDLFVYNHWNIEIHTWKLPNKENSYRVIEVIVEPLSILHPFDGELNKRMETPIASCRGEGTHTNYDMLRDIPPQPARGKVHFTYDVKWISLQDGSDPFRSRWDVFLSMDDAVPDVVEIMGFFLGFALTALVLGTLWTWVMRDLSYKPLIGSDDEEENAEMQLWPLSSSVMRPPANHPLILSICCGTGAHLMVTGFFFVLFFRVGIISQSQGADLLTAAVVLAAVFAPVGGYVTGRLMNVMHVRDGKVIAYAASLTTAICYPLFGLFVVLFVYDVLPSSAAPTYNAVANSWPLILVWIFCMWPLSVAGGWLGYKHGPINHFPVSRPAAKDSRRSDSEEGGDGENTYVSTTVDHFVTEEEQEELEEELEQSRRWCFVKKYRIPLLFLVGGIIPVLCSFINYSYGIAGPIFLGYYSVRSFMVFAYIFFVVSAGAFTVLIYYRQLRAQYYEWWWPSFATGSSAGLYIFILSMSWLIHSSSHLEGSTIFAYMLWFALISVGAGLVTGFAGVASCIVFNRVLYSYIMRRNDSD
jgi:transmembrane 9 superfamily protein 2/4